MDAYLTIVSKRDVRAYEPRPIDPAAERRIRGRLSNGGESANKSSSNAG